MLSKHLRSALSTLGDWMASESFTVLVKCKHLSLISMSFKSLIPFFLLKRGLSRF